LLPGEPHSWKCEALWLDEQLAAAERESEREKKRAETAEAALARVVRERDGLKDDLKEFQNLDERRDKYPWRKE
jgi:hypothetical protein